MRIAALFKRFQGSIPLLVLVLMSSAVDASVPADRTHGKASSDAVRTISVGQALEQLALELEAHIIIVGRLKEQRVSLDGTNRSAMENLKSILRSCSYAVIFNAPPQVTRVIDKTSVEVGSGGPSREADRSSASADGPPAVDAEGDQPALPANPDQEQVLSEAADQADQQGNPKEDPPYAGRRSGIRQANDSLVADQDDDNNLPEPNDLAPSEAGTLPESADVPLAADQHSRLLNRIAQIEEQIGSGEAARFFDHWSQIKDPKYIYNHFDELERLREKLAMLD